MKLEVFTYRVDRTRRTPVGAHVDRRPGMVALSAGVRGWRGVCLIIEKGHRNVRMAS